jgi:hypothetical protein
MTTAVACHDAAADVTVYDEARNRNFGADPALWADARTAKRTFLRFHVTGTGTQPVLGATLRLRVADATDAPSDSGGHIRQISNCSWAELLMTWNTQPAIDGPVLDVAGPVTSGDLVEFDVTSAITGDGLYCFVTETTSINGVIYDSGETATGPQLTLMLDAACTADIDCDDGIHCTGVETCAAGVCQPGAPIDCSALTDVCNVGVCDEATQTCVQAPLPDGTPCGDDDLCNGIEACDAASGQCQVSQAVLCEALEADVNVFQEAPTARLGAQLVLWADKTSEKQTFLRVSANGVGTATVASAVLRLRVATVKDAKSVSGGRIHKISDCGWNELTMTWNTRPAIDGPVLDEAGAVAPGDEVEFDITAGISGDGPHCFAIQSPSSDGVIYNSRETTAGAPDVEIVLDGP